MTNSNHNNGHNANGTFANDNQFWIKRSKHGKNKDHTSQEILDEFFKFYHWSMENEFEQMEVTKNENTNTNTITTRVKVKKYRRTISKRGFNTWLGKGKQYLQELKDKEGSTDYSVVRSYIENFIESEQIQASLAGIINPSAVNRLLAIEARKNYHNNLKVTVNPCTIEIPEDKPD